jgi:hypothetical protein
MGHGIEKALDRPCPWGTCTSYSLSASWRTRLWVKDGGLTILTARLHTPPTASGSPHRGIDVAGSNARGAGRTKEWTQQNRETPSIEIEDFYRAQCVAMFCMVSDRHPTSPRTTRS